MVRLFPPHVLTLHIEGVRATSGFGKCFDTVGSFCRTERHVIVKNVHNKCDASGASMVQHSGFLCVSHGLPSLPRARHHGHSVLCL